MVVGTAAYLSPEQAQGLAADARSDIYSLGCVLYEAVTGRRPFEGESSVTVALQHVNADPPAPSSLVGDLPAELDTIVARAMAKDPAQRYASAADLAEDLERLGRGVSVTAGSADGAPTLAMAATDATAVHPGPRVGATESQPWRRDASRAAGWLLVALALVAAVAALAVVGNLFDSNGEGTEPQGDTDGVPETTPEATTPDEATTTPADVTTTTPATGPAADLAAVDLAVAAVGAEADRALAGGEIDQSARDNLANKAADAGDKARDGDGDALDQVESLRADLNALRDDGDLTQPTFNRLRRAVDDLETAIIAVL
jgi:serine/threonine-protein kinase